MEKIENDNARFFTKFDISMELRLGQNEVLLTDDFIGLTSVEEFDNSFFTTDGGIKIDT